MWRKISATLRYLLNMCELAPPKPGVGGPGDGDLSFLQQYFISAKHIFHIFDPPSSAKSPARGAVCRCPAPSA